MTVALITSLIALIALLGLVHAQRENRVQRLSDECGNPLDRALCALIKDVSDTPQRRRPFH